MKKPGRGCKSGELLKFAKANGWQESRTNGGHTIVIKNGATLSIPVHKAQPISLGVLLKLVKAIESR